MSDFYKGWIGDHIPHKKISQLPADKRDKLILDLEQQILKRINIILQICNKMNITVKNWQTDPQTSLKRLEGHLGKKGVLAELKNMLKTVHPKSSLTTVLQQLLDDGEQLQKFIKNAADLQILKQKQAAGKLKTKGWFGKSGAVRELERLQIEVPKEQGASVNLQTKIKISTKWIDKVLRPLTSHGFLQKRILEDFMQRMAIEKNPGTPYKPAF